MISYAAGLLYELDSCRLDFLGDWGTSSEPRFDILTCAGSCPEGERKMTITPGERARFEKMEMQKCTIVSN